MDAHQHCPARAAWQEVLDGRSSGDLGHHLDGCRHCQAVVEGLTHGNRTWLDVAAELRSPAPPLPQPYLLALEGIARPAPRDNPQRRIPTMTARLHVERMMHRSSIAVTGESATAYALVKLIPAGLAASRPMSLNVALALDVSGSMYEEDGTGLSRLRRVQDAALGAIQKMRPTDTLCLVGFAHNALVLLPPTPLSEKDRIEDVLGRIDTFDVDPGGTAMDEGLALALSEVEKHAGAGTLSRVVVLTDGETSGEQNCRALARLAGERKVPLTLMGVGLDWKASLLKDLANLSQGKWYYVDADQTQEATRVFAEEFEALAATAFTDVEMRLRPTKDVSIKRVRQVAPEIRDVPLEEAEERSLVARLGALQHGTSSRYVLDLRLPVRPDGKYVVTQLELTYDAGADQRESSGQIPLEMNYSAAGHGHVNAEVMKHVDEVELKDMSDTLQKMLQNNDREGAREAAEEMARKGELMGTAGARKTQLAMKVLEELNADGRVRRKTQLELADGARIADVPS